MEKHSKLTLTGFIVVIIIVSFWFLLMLPFLEMVKRRAMRVVCGTNLKGLGTAIMVYANDYDENYPQLPGKGPWAKDLGFPYYLENPDFKNSQSNTLRTISASWYLLIRETDVLPEAFVCPWADQTAFDGSNPNGLSIKDLWDFGPDPYNHVSYAYHNPYGQYPPDGSRSAAFAIAADMNPWFKNGSIIPPRANNNPPQIITIPQHSSDDKTWQSNRDLWKPSNSLNELPYAGPLEKKAKYAVGQNVLFADTHTAWEESPNVGVKRDNIYTFWSAEENPTEQDRQGGTAPTSRSAENDAKSEEDSFLAI